MRAQIERKETTDASFTQKQRDGRGSNPRSRHNLKPFQPGQSGNPGGLPKGTPKISVAYARLLKMTPEEIEKFEPESGAEIIAWKQFNNARGGKPVDSLNAAREVTDRTEGRARQSIEVINTGELERLVIRVQERVLAQAGVGLSREEVIERIVAYRPELAGAFE